MINFKINITILWSLLGGPVLLPRLDDLQWRGDLSMHPQSLAEHLEYTGSFRALGGTNQHLRA